MRVWRAAGARGGALLGLPVLAADTIVVVDERILGKPAGAAEADDARRGARRSRSATALASA
jgi:predicted house-cleaning NTP pyrophosphatase (Maf/HAM1 superfamily)